MKKGFTLVELVIVIVILGILAAIALPKFIDITGDAKVSATKAGLGAIRSVVALKYSKNLADGSAQPYPTTLSSTDFFDGKFPTNKLNNTTAINYIGSAVAVTNQQNTDYGWWLVTDGTTQIGQAGAYSDGTFDTITTGW